MERSENPSDFWIQSKLPLSRIFLKPFGDLLYQFFDVRSVEKSFPSFWLTRRFVKDLHESKGFIGRRL